MSKAPTKLPWSNASFQSSMHRSVAMATPMFVGLLAKTGMPSPNSQTVAVLRQQNLPSCTRIATSHKQTISIATEFWMGVGLHAHRTSWYVVEVYSEFHECHGGLHQQGAHEHGSAIDLRNGERRSAALVARLYCRNPSSTKLGSIWDTHAWSKDTYCKLKIMNFTCTLRVLIFFSKNKLLWSFDHP